MNLNELKLNPNNPRIIKELEDIRGNMKNNVTSKQVKKHTPNPTGKGGFGDHPENRNDRGLIKKPMFYINQYGTAPADSVPKAIRRPDSEKTTYEKIALSYLVKSMKDPKDLINRVDGMPKSNLEVSGKDGQPLQLQVLAGAGFLHELTNTEHSGDAQVATGSVVSEPEEVQDTDMAQTSEEDDNSDQ